MFLGLPQVEPEDVGLRVFDSLDAGAAGRRRVGDTEGCKDLGEAVTSVDVERHAATGVDGHGDPADTVAQGVGQFGSSSRREGFAHSRSSPASICVSGSFQPQSEKLKRC